MLARLKTLQSLAGWWGLAFGALLALDLALGLAGPPPFILRLAVYLTGAGTAVRLFRVLSRKLIWRLRNRLIITYLHMAVVPVVLLLILVWLGGWAVVGQVAAHLVNSELQRRTAELDSMAHIVANAPEQHRESLAMLLAPVMQELFPSVEMLIRGRDVERIPANATVDSPPAAWRDAAGLVIKDGQVHSWAHVAKDNVQVTILASLSPDFLAQLVPGLGEVFLRPISSGGPVSRGKRTNSGGTRSRPRSYLPGAYNRFDVDFNWLTPMEIALWDGPDRSETAGLVVHTRTSAVLATVFGGGMDFGQNALLLFLIILGILVLVELYSLFTGISLTRTITGAVHNLYEGTQHIKEGDFSHRIAVTGKDQLAELGHSFNRMTENLERLIVVEKEQERLQSELAIAREVQSQLFPRSAPVLRSLELTGVCHPARTVSGDYYDFVGLPDATAALAIGDVAGKGISAALLMASIQSIMRTQLTAGIPAVVHASAAGAGESHAWSTAHMVSQLNRQLYASTAPEKYATFFFGLYDGETRTLTYTNAGHLPPVLLRDRTAEMLETTGTVVGAFPSAVYEERSIRIGPGDLLVAYTDGIVEPENEYGEAFGEDRLLELLMRYRNREAQEIAAHIVAAVEQWTGSSELQDDMTLLLARGRA